MSIDNQNNAPFLMSKLGRQLGDAYPQTFFELNLMIGESDAISGHARVILEKGLKKVGADAKVTCAAVLYLSCL
jgi:hypothetical protein